MARALPTQSPKALLTRGSSSSNNNNNNDNRNAGGRVIRDRDYATFCSISLSSEPRGSKSIVEDVAALQQQQQQLHQSLNPHTQPRNPHRHSCCAAISRIPLFVVVVSLLFLAGVTGVVLTLLRIATPSTSTTDAVLFRGAIVSTAFSLVVVVCYVQSAAVRSHPNPLIFSKSLVDLLLAALYVFQYSATEFTASPVVLPRTLASLTQALLVCSEFWFVAIPIDLVQSITNPFTSYARNLRRYWLYATLSGASCGLLLWLLDDSGGQKEPDDRFFWFHQTTQHFVWHRWLLYHVWLVFYLIFGVCCIRFVTRRLQRGLDETIDVRRRILAHGVTTCGIYMTWSLALLALFAAINLTVTKTANALVDVSAFGHAARGIVNVVVWFVVNASALGALCQSPLQDDDASIDAAQASATSSSRSVASNSAITTTRGEPHPQLNRALRRQIVHLATSGIIASVQQFHAMQCERLTTNQTIALDWTHRNSTSNSTSVTSRAQPVAPPQRMPRFLPLAMPEMQFVDFQPRVFASIRALYNINDSAYQRAFESTLNERISEGRSGAFVFHSRDRKYIVKSMTPRDKAALLNLIPSYVRYLQWNPQTLLPRFLGCHAMKMYGQVFYVVVMNNILSSEQIIHRRYDIKGSWVDRNAPACVLGERYRCSKCNQFFTFGAAASTVGGGHEADKEEKDDDVCAALDGGGDHYPDITLRDNDLKKRLKVAPATAATLLKQLTRDSNFLASNGIMDYSLLIGAHYSHFEITTTTTTRHKEQATDAEADASVNHLDSDAAFVHNLVDASASNVEDDDNDTGNGKATSPFKRRTPRRVSFITTRPSMSSMSSSSNSLLAAPAGGERTSHCYRAHQVSGPSAYYFGLVDILQHWTLSKQCERMYKVHVLRKDARGVSAMAPTPYAARFQQKMHQLFSSSQASSGASSTAHHVVLDERREQQLHDQQHDGRSASSFDSVV